jgi:hypothetical protein
MTNKQEVKEGRASQNGFFLENAHILGGVLLGLAAISFVVYRMTTYYIG